jgi:two-component system, chemotaxis family, CheB/CheR fusion protein
MLVAEAVDATALVQRLIVDRFAPAAVLTNDRFEALYFCGPTHRFLAQPKGAPTQNLLELAREGLRSRLRSAIREVNATGSTVVVADAQVRRAHAFEQVKLTILPAMRTRGQGGLLLAVFEDAPKPAPVALEGDAAAVRLVRQLEEELKATKEDLQSTIERLASSVADLKSSNEEVVSANEELESAKEELQSLNEELNTVNQQLQSKIAQLETKNSSLKNLIESSEIATVCLDRDFRIKWFSPAARELFSLMASDVGRPVSAFAPMLSDPSVIEDAKKVIAESRRMETEVRLDRQRWYIRTVPFRTPGEKIEGAIITFTDITHIRRKAQEELTASTALAQSLEAQVEERVRALRAELFKLAVSEEHERRTYAGELHDELCQPLAAANLELAASMRTGDPVERATLQKLSALIDKAERAARSIMFRISPPVLYDMGFVPALEWLAEEMRRDFGLAVNMSGLRDDEHVPLDETVRAVLFRCVRELLVNVAKHAKVRTADLSISRGDGTLTVSVSDAGVGFNPARVAKAGSSGHFGLISVRERIGFIGGSLTIESVPGDGTLATLTVPLPDPPAGGAASPLTELSP